MVNIDNHGRHHEHGTAHPRLRERQSGNGNGHYEVQNDVKNLSVPAAQGAEIQGRRFAQPGRMRGMVRQIVSR